MENVLNFKVVIYQDEDSIFVAECPEIPGCHTQGDTYEEVMTRIQEAIKLCLKVAEKDKEYRKAIDFGNNKSPKLIGFSSIQLPRPSFV